MTLFAKVEHDAYSGRRYVEDERASRRQTCIRFLHGGLPGTRLYVALAVQHLKLLMELFNPLWAMLLLATRQNLTAREQRRLRGLSRNLLINGRRLSEWSLRSFKRVMGNPYSSNLTLALMVLAREWRTDRRDEIQSWLQDRFMLMLLLICQQPELKYSSRFVYRLLDHLFRQETLAPVRDWPRTLNSFKKRVKKIHRLQSQLQRKRGYNQTDALSIIQTFFNDLHDIPAWSAHLNDYLSGLDRQADFCLKKARWQGDVLIDTQFLPQAEDKAKLILNSLPRYLQDHPPKEPMPILKVPQKRRSTLIRVGSDSPMLTQ